RELRLVAAGRDPRDAGARPGPVPGRGPLCRAGLRPAGLPLWRPGLAAATAAPAERAPDRAAALRPVHGIPGVSLGEGNFPAPVTPYPPAARSGHGNVQRNTPISANHRRQAMCSAWAPV